MIFFSMRFAVFFFIIFICCYFVRRRTVVQWLLIIASLLFSIQFGPFTTTCLVVDATVVTSSTLLIDKYRYAPRKVRWILFWAIWFQVVLLAFFKYANTFFQYLGYQDSNASSIIMPVGLSFFVFSAISLMVDTYRGDIKGVSIREAFFYLFFFPKIVSGPITKAKTFIPQVRGDNCVCSSRISYGIQRFVIGAFQKIVIADRLAVAVDSVYNSPNVYSGLSLFIISITYSLQLLFDFSGYSDMAIGVAHVLGYDLGENFNLPYLSGNPSEFWKRWHITLSAWLSDYVYIPLGGSKKGNVYVNIMVIMLISGIWHGSTRNFVVWGLLHGFALCVYHFLRDNIFFIRFDNKLTRYLCRILWLLWVDFLWIVFRTDNMSDALSIMRRILHMSNGITYYYTWSIGAIILTIGIQSYAIIRYHSNNPMIPRDLNDLRNRVLFCIVTLSVFAFGYFGDTFFIYQQF